jgi:hypothetical protein
MISWSVGAVPARRGSPMVSCHLLVCAGPADTAPTKPTPETQNKQLEEIEGTKKKR